MHDPASILVFDCIVAFLIALDLGRVLVRGRAQPWLGPEITRQQHPEQYRRYVYESFGMLTVCVIVFFLWHTLNQLV